MKCCLSKTTNPNLNIWNAHSSTTVTLIKAIDSWKVAIDRGEKVVCAFLDFKTHASFDTKKSFSQECGNGKIIWVNVIKVWRSGVGRNVDREAAMRNNDKCQRNVFIPWKKDLVTGILPYRDDNVNPFRLAAVFNDYSSSSETQKYRQIIGSWMMVMIMI